MTSQAHRTGYKYSIKMSFKSPPIGSEGQHPSERMRMTEESTTDSLNATNSDELRCNLAIDPTSRRTLENLPLEMRVHILCQATNVSNLRDLVLSSRIYWEAYKSQRRSILQAVLTNNLGSSGFLDAYLIPSCRTFGSSTLARANRLEVSIKIELRKKWHSRTMAFLHSYRGEQMMEPIKVKQADLEEICRLVRLVQIVAREFFKATLSKHPLTGQDLDLEFEDLSEKEVQRIYGAILRLEVCCELWGDLGRAGYIIEGEGGVIPTSQIRYGMEDLPNFAALFFSKLNPWEVEEIACVRDFLLRFYDGVNKDRDLIPAADKIFSQRFSVRNAWRRALNEWERSIDVGQVVFDYMSETLLSCGVELHAKMIRCQGCGPAIARQKVRYMDDREVVWAIWAESGLFLSENLATYFYPTDETHQIGSMVAVGNPPNVAWVRYLANRENECLSAPVDQYLRVKLRSWGYVMWDDATLEKLGIMEKLDPLSITEHFPRISLRFNYEALLGDIIDDAQVCGDLTPLSVNYWN